MNDQNSSGNGGNSGCFGPVHGAGGPGGGGQGGTFQGGIIHFTPEPPRAFSMNNRFIVEPYISDRTIKTSTTGGGFALIQQKVVVKGLKLLVDIKLESYSSYTAIDAVSVAGPTTVLAGSIIFVREELLHSAPWAKQILEADGLGKFMIIEKQFVEFIQPV